MKWTLGVSIANHDASICLLRDHKIELFLQEERSSRYKHDSDLPLKSLNEVKKITDIIDDLVVVNCDDEDKYIIRSSLVKMGVKVLNLTDWGNKFHHLYHAASGFYHSGFKKAFCLVIDGWGTSTNISIDSEEGKIEGYETTSIFTAKSTGEFDLLYKHLHYDPSKTDVLATTSVDPEDFLRKDSRFEVSHRIDIGVLYGTVTSHVGFDPVEGAGKLMGMSSYGLDDDNIPPFFINKKLHTNMNLFTNSRILDIFAYPHLKEYKNNFQKKANLAYAAQKALEQKFEQRVNFILNNFKTETRDYFDDDKIRIVISGGCALNVVGNSYLKEKFPTVEFYIDPIPNDAGQSIGAAKVAYYTTTECDIIERTESLYTGPSYSPEDIRKAISKEI